MSYDIDLECPTCGHGPSTDPTYNLGALVHEALTGEPFPSPGLTPFDQVILGKQPERPRGFHVLNNMTGADSIPMLGRAIERLTNPEFAGKLREAEALNKGWGTIPDAIEVCQRLLEFAQEHPRHAWHVR